MQENFVGAQRDSAAICEIPLADARGSVLTCGTEAVPVSDWMHKDWRGV